MNITAKQLMGLSITPIIIITWWAFITILMPSLQPEIQNRINNGGRGSYS